jgi:tetratricopeptide (TPR) repeat protein
MNWRDIVRQRAAKAGRLALVVAYAFFVRDTASFVDCVTASRDVSAKHREEVCGAAYEATGDPRVGLQYVRALYHGGEYDKAESEASLLLETEVRAEAFHLLGWIIKRLKRPGEATSAFEQALELHLHENQLREMANDQQALALLLKDDHWYAEALRILDHCIADARASEARREEGYCHLAAAQTLSRLGFAEGAGRELEIAEPLFFESKLDLASLYIEQANVHQEAGDDAWAAVLFDKALRTAQQADLLDMQIRAHLNLAYSRMESDQLEAAERHLDVAREIDREGDFKAERLHQEGRLAFHRNDLSHASSLLERAYEGLPTKDEERVEVAILRARIALGAVDLRTAEIWARKGIDQVEEIRGEQSAIEVRGWVLASRRAPYELLFVALTRADRTDEALLVFDQWYGRTLLDGLSRPAHGDTVSLQDAALQTDTLSALLPSLTKAPLMRGEDPRIVLDAVRSADVLALLVAEEEVWRLTVTSGRIQIQSLGSLKEMHSSLTEFIARPLDRKLADELGALILPDDLVRTTTESLRVVLDSELAALPVAALRRNGRPLIAARPIVRTQRLSAVRCVPPSPYPQRAMVMADANDDLIAARREGERVARLFGTTALTGTAATSVALFAGPPVDLLHIATHADPGDAGRFLRLHDGPVPALQLLARKLTVPTVVLAACGAAQAGDAEGASSLVTAFLAGGARHVVATLRLVSDRGAEDLTRSFYDAGGAGDPVRGLATAQRQLADTANQDWPYFAVFGQDTCPSP